MNRAGTAHSMDKKCWNSLVVKLGCNTLVTIFRCRLEKNIRMNLNEYDVRTWNGLICLSMDGNDRLFRE